MSLWLNGFRAYPILLIVVATKTIGHETTTIVFNASTIDMVRKTIIFSTLMIVEAFPSINCGRDSIDSATPTIGGIVKTIFLGSKTIVFATKSIDFEAPSIVSAARPRRPWTPPKQADAP